ncbi:MAG: hypothetical protein MJZ37_00955 [Bacilli bacterium]|nr:hypothetical protein [Bacilli bacterium]
MAKKYNYEISPNGFGFYTLRYKIGRFGRWIYYKRHNQTNIFYFRSYEEALNENRRIMEKECQKKK